MEASAYLRKHTMSDRISFYLVAVLFVFGLACLTAGCGHKPLNENPAPFVDSSTAGSITGTVTFSGAPPLSRHIDMSAEPACVKQNSGPVNYPSVVVGKGGRLANVVVYIKSGLGDFRYDAPTQPVILNQKGCMYGPHVLAVMTNQPVEVKNEDPVLHNIRIAPRKNDEWNQSEDVDSPPVTYSFQHPELAVQVRCNVHPWMRAIAFVFDHPYFAVTSTAGTFALKNLPPGTYTVEAWQEKYGVLDRTVTVAPKQSQSVSFAFKSAP